MRHLLLPTLLLASIGCSTIPAGPSTFIDAPLWDPSGVISTADGLYVPLLHSGKLVFIGTSGETSLVDLGAGRLDTLKISPDQSELIAFVKRYQCDEKDPKRAKNIHTLEDCPSESIVISKEALSLNAGVVGDTLPIPAHMNALSWSNDASYAIAYLDLAKDPNFKGVINLTSIQVIDTIAGTSSPVTVGFAAEQVLFTQDNSKALVLSSNRVAVVNLSSSPAQTEVIFPLTLDPRQTVNPIGVSITPDGRYAMIPIQGSSDLYVLDLEQHSVNMLGLSSQPSSIDVNAVTDQSVLVYDSYPRVDVIDHARFDVESIPLIQPMNHIASIGGESILLYSDNSLYHDLYQLDLNTFDLISYRLENAALSVHIAPTQEFAIALTRAESGFGSGTSGLYDAHPGMEIVDLRIDRPRTSPYLLEGVGIGVAFSATDSRLNALILQQDIDYLYALDLYTGDTQQLDLSEPPIAIGSIPGGAFFITHNAGTGLISLVDPTTLEVTEVAGFATHALFSPTKLMEEVTQ